jgi:general stress protein CsbA
MTLKRPSVAVALAIIFLGTATALNYAHTFNLIGSDAAKRTMQVMIGLILAAYANLMPKDVGRWRASALAAARAQSVLRVGGWSMTLAGLAYAGLWAFASLAFADAAAMTVVASALLITTVYGGWILGNGGRRRTRLERPPPDCSG